MNTNDQAGVLGECTLPAAERPVRAAEFDQLFAVALRSQQRVSPTVLRWQVDAAAESVARDLASRETGCCSFFTFAFTQLPGAVQVDVEVPPAFAGVLDALAARAAAGMSS